MKKIFYSIVCVLTAMCMSCTSKHTADNIRSSVLENDTVDSCSIKDDLQIAMTNDYKEIYYLYNVNDKDLYVLVFDDADMQKELCTMTIHMNKPTADTTDICNTVRQYISAISYKNISK